MEVGYYYLVNYKDPSYPCNCGCHRVPGMIHCFPCCSDTSFRGLVRVEKFVPGDMYENDRFYCVDPVRNEHYSLKWEDFVDNTDHKYHPFKNKKNCRFYEFLYSLRNETNGQEGTMMIAYRDNDDKRYVREVSEFLEKFYIA